VSFILDALKKSENERQQQASAEFSSVPRSSDVRPTPRWLWVLGLLLAVNAAVVGGLLLRNPAPQRAAEAMPAADEVIAGAPGPTARESSAPPAETDSFRDRVARARENLPPRPSATARPAAQEPAASDSQAVAKAPAPVESAAALPSLAELRAEGRLQLPDLHIDLHVYSEVPARRFVSINAQKLRESETLQEGPRVREITPDGVILVHEGTAFIVRK
jgi:general secretion pathway protein B